MSNSSIIGIIVGAAEIYTGTQMSNTQQGQQMIASGVATELSSIAQLLATNPIKGLATTTRSPIAPFRAVYGEARVGGTLVFENAWAQANQVLDLVSVLACHPCQEVSEVLFDQQRVQMQTIDYPPPYQNRAFLSFTPLNSGSKPGAGTPYDINTITRAANGIVTVSLRNAIPFLLAGDKITIQNLSHSGLLSEAAASLNGIFQVAQVTGYDGSNNPIDFTYLSGGTPITIAGQGEAQTLWPNYFTYVYAEFLDGTQSLGMGTGPNPSLGTFIGMIEGTPWAAGSNARFITPLSPGPAQGNSTTNPWAPAVITGASNYSLVNKTAVMLRLIYGKDNNGNPVFVSGIPQCSFFLYGNNQIWDPRTTAICTTNGTGINSVTVTGTSSCYRFPPTIQVIPDSRDTITTPAVLTAVMTPPFIVDNLQSAPSPITNGVLSSITITSAGVGYVHTPTLRIVGYTNNSCLCAADYLVNKDWGFKLDYVTDGSPGVPVDALIAAANICDEQVLRQDGTYEPRYCCDGSFELNKRRGEVLEQLLSSCAGKLTTASGQWVIHPGYGPADYPSDLPVYDLQAIASGPMVWKPMVSVRSLVNGCKGNYISKDNLWKSTDFPPYCQDTLHGYFGPSEYAGDINLAQDGGERRWLDLTLPFTVSYSCAQRLAKIALLRARQFGLGTFTCNMQAYDIVPLDIIAANCRVLGWEEKEIEVATVRLQCEKSERGMALSVVLDVQETDPSIYEWSTNEELTPQGYQAATFSNISQINEYFPFPWSPGLEIPLTGDALPNAPATFGMTPVYGFDAGNPNVSLQISGFGAVNQLDTEIGMPVVAAVPLDTGGTIPAGNWVITMSTRDGEEAGFGRTPFLDISNVTTTGTTSSINVNWVYGSGSAGGDIYMAQDFDYTDEYVWHWQASVAGSANSTTLSSFNVSTPGGSDADFDHYTVGWMHVIHSGVWDAQVQAVTSNTVTLYGPGMTSGQYNGYTLSLMAKYDGVSPTIVLNLPVATSGASDLNNMVLFTIGTNSLGQQLPDLTTLLVIGDWLIVRDNATFTSTSYCDPNVANGYYPGGDTDVEAGHVVVVLSGPDAGDTQTIDSVTNDGFGNPTVYNMVNPWTIQPNTGDIVAICDPTTFGTFATVPTTASSSLSGVVANVPVENLANEAWLFIVYATDSKGRHEPASLVPMTFSPMRDCILLQVGGTRVVTS